MYDGHFVDDHDEEMQSQMMKVVFQVVMGGGRQMFTPINESDPEYPDRLGLRQDGRNLIQVSTL